MSVKERQDFAADDRQASFVWPPKSLGRRYLLQHLMPQLKTTCSPNKK